MDAKSEDTNTENKCNPKAALFLILVRQKNFNDEVSSAAFTAAIQIIKA
jgi:hypothetical protein